MADRLRRPPMTPIAAELGAEPARPVQGYVTDKDGNLVGHSVVFEGMPIRLEIATRLLAAIIANSLYEPGQEATALEAADRLIAAHVETRGT